MPWQTFWLEPTGRDRVALRRYTRAQVRDLGELTCAGGFHTAVAWLDVEVQTRLDADGVRREKLTFDPDDPRWPLVCTCGYMFSAVDERQVWLEQLFQRTDTGELRALHRSLHPPDVLAAEAGASWDAVWMPAKWRGVDGVSLMVRCPRNDGAGPGSDWPVDMPSTESGGRWSRHGDPRACEVTATPSISIGQSGTAGAYHGWLTRGVLSDPV